MTAKHAVILLAGTGTRLKPLTNDIHKALLEIGGETILDRQIRHLQRNGVATFHFVLGHRETDIRDHIARRHPGLDAVFVVNAEFASTNTGHSLFLALGTFDADFVLLDGDVVMHGALMDKLLSYQEKTVLLCETDPAKLDAEAVKVRASGEAQNGLPVIAEIGKPVPLRDAAGESLGVGLYGRDWGAALKSELRPVLQDSARRNWYYEDAMQALLGRGAAPSPLRLLATGDFPWAEIDDHADLKRALETRWD